jgi:steroid delta-isomerase-like uncharacterized protein
MMTLMIFGGYMQEECPIPQLVEDVRVGKMGRRHFIKTLKSMGISAAGVGAILAAALSPSASGAPVQEKLQGEPAIHLQLHEQHIAHQSQGNTHALHDDYARNAVVEDSMYPEPFIGRAAIMGRKGAGMAAIADLKINITNRVVHGNQVTAEWVATGTHNGDLPGMPATGRSFTLRGVTVTIRHDSKIVRESIYYDVSELRRQLGPDLR